MIQLILHFPDVSKQRSERGREGGKEGVREGREEKEKEEEAEQMRGPSGCAQMGRQDADQTSGEVRRLPEGRAGSVQPEPRAVVLIGQHTGRSFLIWFSGDLWEPPGTSEDL